MHMNTIPANRLMNVPFMRLKRPVDNKAIPENTTEKKPDAMMNSHLLSCIIPNVTLTANASILTISAKKNGEIFPMMDDCSLSASKICRPKRASNTPESTWLHPAKQDITHSPVQKPMSGNNIFSIVVHSMIINRPRRSWRNVQTIKISMVVTTAAMISIKKEL